LGLVVERSEIEERRSRNRLVAIQEDLDWFVYGLVGIANGECLREFSGGATLNPEERPYLAESAPDTLASGDIDVWNARKEAIRTISEIALVETPNYKRRWWGARGVFASKVATYAEEAVSAAEEVILEHIEDRLSGAGSTATSLRSIPPATNRATNDALCSFVMPDRSSDQAIAELTAREAVPFFAAHRYTDSGLEKYATWEETWANQRREDAGELNVTCAVPPKYAQEDFRDANYWRLRGKLDVPKERFISYPGCESDEDHEPVYGWAGWNHLQRAQALAQLYNDRRAEGWDKERLIPMLAGLLELMPWLLQWHNEPSEELGGQRPGEQFSLFLEGQCAELGYTHEDLRNWRPAAKRGRAARKSPAP
jgi:hypothetical protein